MHEGILAAKIIPLGRKLGRVFIFKLDTNPWNPKHICTNLSEKTKDQEQKLMFTQLSHAKECGQRRMGVNCMVFFKAILLFCKAAREAHHSAALKRRFEVNWTKQQFTKSRVVHILTVPDLCQGATSGQTYSPAVPGFYNGPLASLYMLARSVLKLFRLTVGGWNYPSIQRDSQGFKVD